MYPYEIIFGMTLYEICVLIGLTALMVVFRLYADKKGFSANFQNFILFTIVATVVLGYLSAILFQAFYNFLADGVFVIDKDTGATFYGGFIGGVVACSLIYFIGGYFLFKDREHIKVFKFILDCGGFCVPLAHAFGRIGCFFAGCCHGGFTDTWYGVYHAGTGLKVIPLQLYEAAVLFIIFALLFARAFKSSRYSHAMSIYLVSYAVWRFIAEFFRRDDRGASPISFLSPSQLTAIFLIAVAVVLYFVTMKIYTEKEKKDDASDET